MKKQLFTLVAFFTVFFWGIAIGLASAAFIYNDEGLAAGAVAFGLTPVAAWAVVKIATREPKRYMQLIRCPECNSRCEAIVEQTLPFYTYVHECEHCGYIITESEWEPLK